jgi:hypothetical protein
MSGGASCLRAVSLAGQAKRSARVAQRRAPMRLRDDLLSSPSRRPCQRAPVCRNPHIRDASCDRRDAGAPDVASPTRSTGASEKHTHHDQNEHRNPDRQHDACAHATRAFGRRSYMTKGLLADRSGEPVIHSTSRWSALKAGSQVLPWQRCARRLHRRRSGQQEPIGSCSGLAWMAARCPRARARRISDEHGPDARADGVVRGRVYFS